MRLALALLSLASLLHAATALRISAFNIKSFGDSKLSNETVAGIIVKVSAGWGGVISWELAGAGGAQDSTKQLVQGLSVFSGGQERLLPCGLRVTWKPERKGSDGGPSAGLFLSLLQLGAGKAG